MITGQTRLIDLSVSDLQQLIEGITEKVISEAIQRKENTTMCSKTYSFNELAELGIVGKYHKIKSLIKSGALTQLADGRISGFSLYKYLNNKKS